MRPVRIEIFDPVLGPAFLEQALSDEVQIRSLRKVKWQSSRLVLPKGKARWRKAHEPCGTAFQVLDASPGASRRPWVHTTQKRVLVATRTRMESVANLLVFSKSLAN